MVLVFIIYNVIFLKDIIINDFIISYIAIASNLDLNDSIVFLHNTISARLCNTRIYFHPLGIDVSQ